MGDHLSFHDAAASESGGDVRYYMILDDLHQMIFTPALPFELSG